MRSNGGVNTPTRPDHVGRLRQQKSFDFLRGLTTKLSIYYQGKGFRILSNFKTKRIIIFTCSVCNIPRRIFYIRIRLVDFMCNSIDRQTLSYRDSYNHLIHINLSICLTYIYIAERLCLRKKQFNDVVCLLNLFHRPCVHNNNAFGITIVYFGLRYSLYLISQSSSHRVGLKQIQ